MSRRAEVVAAVIDLIQAALPNAEVVGLDTDDRAPARVPAGGRVVVRHGDPGDPEVDLSPLAYNWRHPVPIEAAALSDETLDAMLTAIGEAIEADRQLSGLCDWIEPSAPLNDEIYIAGGGAPRTAVFDVIASYVSTSPLT